MKKIMIIDGGPRSHMNTAAMINAFVEGVHEGGGETKVVRLYDLDYKGCRSCMACQLKAHRTPFCRFPDGITDILKECIEADGLVLASPIYYGEITAQLRAFWERLTFPWLNYAECIFKAPKWMPVTFIYTMNGSPDNGEKVRRSSMRHVETMTGIAMGHQVDVIIANNTTQVKDYDLYCFASNTAEDKARWREEHWEDDLSKAREAGKRMLQVEAPTMDIFTRSLSDAKTAED